MANKSYRFACLWFFVVFFFFFFLSRADGKEEIVMKVECGSKPGFSTSGWMGKFQRVSCFRFFLFFSSCLILFSSTASSTYQVNVIESDPFTAIIDQLKEKAGAQSRADEIFGVDKKSGAAIKFDPTKTVKENGITPTHHPIMRFPSKTAGKNYLP